MATDSPFSPVHSRQSFYEAPGVGEALRRLDDGLGAREPFLLVTGESGTGKTSLAHEAVARWGSRVTYAFVAYPALTGAELLEEIVRRFGADPPNGASRPKLIACVERALTDVANRGQIAILVVDDAHDLSTEQLEQLRLLVNTAQSTRRPLEVLLIGLPALEARLDDPEFVTLRQRVSVHTRIAALSAAETRSYLHHRVSAVGGNGPTLFTKKICRDIAARTRGVPRQINTLAAEALRLARAAGSQAVTHEHVEIAASTMWGLVPPGDFDDSVGVDDAPIAAPGPTPPTAAPAPAPSPTQAAKLQPAPTPKPAAVPPSSKPQAPAKAEAPPLPRIAAELPRTTKKHEPEDIDEGFYPQHTPPAAHDPREWVVRFVGDKGPVQIGSRVAAESLRPLTPLEESGEEPAAPNEAPSAPKPRPELARSQALWRNRIDMRMATTAALATIVVVAAIALLIRAGGRAKNHAAQEVVTSATAPQETESSAPKSDSRKAAPPPASSTDETPKPRGNGPFTVDVGGPYDYSIALDQRDRLQALTGIEGYVVPSANGEAYRVVLGAYRSYDRASSAANMLVRSRTLRYANVVTLPAKEVRR